MLLSKFRKCEMKLFSNIKSDFELLIKSKNKKRTFVSSNFLRFYIYYHFYVYGMFSKEEILFVVARRQRNIDMMVKLSKLFDITTLSLVVTSLNPEVIDYCIKINFIYDYNIRFETKQIIIVQYFKAVNS